MKNVSLLIKSAVFASTLVLLPTTSITAAADHLSAENSQNMHRFVDGGMKMKRHFKRLAKHLNLTDDQKEKIKAIYAEKKENRMANKETMMDFRQQVKALLLSPTFDEQAFLELHSQQQNQFSQMALSRAKSKHAVMQVLNAAQQEQLLTMKSKRRGMFK